MCMYVCMSMHVCVSIYVRVYVARLAMEVAVFYKVGLLSL